MRFVARIWLGFAALGAGLIHLAVAASAPLALLPLFAAAGIAEIGWAVVTIASPSLRFRRSALLGALLAIVLWAAALTLGAQLGASVESLPAYPLACASLLDLVIAITVAISLRRNPSPASAREGSEPGAGWMLLGLASGALLMTLVALPALGQTQAGILAAEGPHAHHSSTEIQSGHEGH